MSCDKFEKPMRHALFTTICAAALLGAEVANADPVDWTQYECSFNITFPGYAGSTTLADFPVLVKLSAALNDFRYSKCKVANGGDLRFSLPDGTLLQSEVDTWNPNGTSLVWVKVPQFDRHTKIVAHYGCDTPAAVTPADVWSADYVGVWHLNESAVPMAESSGVSTPFSTAGGSGIVYGASGAVGGAVDFSEGNTSARLSAADDDDLDGFTDFTFEAWTKQERAPSAIAFILAKRTKNAEDVAYFLYNNYSETDWKLGRNICGISTNGTTTSAYIVGTGNNMTPVWGEWCHQAFVRDTAANTGCGYVDGVVVNGGASGSSPVFASASALHLGNSQGNGNTFNGLIDELRISRVARSADWIQASHDAVAKAGFAVYSSDLNDWKSYSHKFKVSFENAFSDDTTLLNFPVLVRIAEYDANTGAGIPGFDYDDLLAENGGDLRFADAEGNLLSSEIDTWNTNGESLVWVKVPSLSTNTTLTAYYGCILPGDVTPSEVWSADYVGVWHLGESALPLKESSSVSTSFSYSYNSKETLGVSGAVGGAVDFSVGDAHSRLRADDDDDLDGFSDCTFEVWSKQDAQPTRISGIVTKRNSSKVDCAYYIYNNYSTEAAKLGRNIFAVTADGTDQTTSFSIGSGHNMSPNWGEWCHQAFVRDISGTQMAYGYVNGSTKKTGIAQTGAIHASAEPLWLGNFNGGSAGFEGQIDELRISRVARSQAWLKASHDTVAVRNFATCDEAVRNSRGFTIYIR